MTSRTDSRLPAYLLMSLGVFFLASQLFSFSLWPLFVILPGLPFLYFANTGPKHNAGLIFPGLIISGTGMILLYQSLFSHFESWAYIWTLYPVFVGIGLLFLGKRTDKPQEAETGRGMIRWGLTAFAGLALLFEVFIFQSLLGGLTGWLIPLGLIGAGALLLMNRKSDDDYGGKRKNEDIREKRKNGFSPHIDEDLQRRIDEALAEDTRN